MWRRQFTYHLAVTKLCVWCLCHTGWCHYISSQPWRKLENNCQLLTGLSFRSTVFSTQNNCPHPSWICPFFTVLSACDCIWIMLKYFHLQMLCSNDIVTWEMNVFIRKACTNIFTLWTLEEIIQYIWISIFNIYLVKNNVYRLSCFNFG